MPSPKSPPGKIPAGRSFDWLAAGVVVYGLAQFLAAFAPSVWTWGIDYWSELPLWARSLFLLLVAVAILPGLPEKVAEKFEKSNWPRRAGWAAAAVGLILFIVLRSRGYSYGDGYSFRSYFGSGGFPDVGGQLALMAGDLIAHWLVYRATVMPLGGSVEIAYSLISAVAGVVTLAAIVAIARKLYPKNRGARWTLIAAGFSSGMAVLWFGHVEAYSLVGAALMWSLACLLLDRKGLAWGLWILGCAFHLLAIAFLPVLVWSTWGQKISSSLSRPKAVVLFLIGWAGWGIAVAVFSIFKQGIFVPFLATEDSTYTVFSTAHMADTANLLLFVAPLGLIGTVVWMFDSYASRTSGRDETTIPTLTVAAASLWYFSFWVDPLIGAFRDWDLIGVYGLPFSILGAVLLLRRTGASGAIRSQWVLVAVLGIIHTGAFVATVQSEDKAMARIDRLVREDVHYTRDFYRGERLMSWSYVLTHLLEKQELALDHLRKRAIWDPSDGQSWMNLGSVYWHLQQYDSSAVSFERSLAIDSSDARSLEMLTFAYSAAANWPGARSAVERLSRARALRTVELNVWAFSLISMNQNAKADSILGISLMNDPNQREAYYYRAIVDERRQDTASALANYERAMVPRPDIEDVYLRATKLYQAQQRWSDAERVCTAWQSNYPNAPMANFLLGMCRIATRRYPEARDALERSAALDPRSALTLFYLATAYRNLGEKDKAAQAARRAADIDTTLALPYLELIYLAADAEDRAAAVAATREYLKRAPYDSGMTYLQQFMEP